MVPETCLKEERHSFFTPYIAAGVERGDPQSFFNERGKSLDSKVHVIQGRLQFLESLIHPSGNSRIQLTHMIGDHFRIVKGEGFRNAPAVARYPPICQVLMTSMGCSSMTMLSPRLSRMVNSSTASTPSRATAEAHAAIHMASV